MGFFTEDRRSDDGGLMALRIDNRRPIGLVIDGQCIDSSVVSAFT